MKILSIISSYRKNGNTAKVIQCIQEELLGLAKENNAPVEVETIFLGHQNIEFCRGCRVCFDRGEEQCPNKDHVLEIRDKILKADALILASPVYVEDINGVMKNWIDRMAFHNHRPAFAGKNAVLMTTSGMGSSNHALKTMSHAAHAWGFHIAGKGKFQTGATMSYEQIKSQYSHKIRRLAEELFYSIKNEEAVIPSFYSLLAFKIQQQYWKSHQNDHSIDYRYWENNGWLSPECDFFVKHKANVLKVKAARWTGRIVSKYVLK